ncbi:MAG: hypothetical protein ABF294_08425 [Flavobacteriales bacterium]
MKDTILKDSKSLDYIFRAGFSVDIVIVTYHNKKLKILLHKKEEEIIENDLGLPGKLILPNENIDKAIDKLLINIIGVNSFYKKELTTFSDIGRHPLGRIITFVYYGLVSFDEINKNLSADLKWCEITEVPNLILDHNQITKKVFSRFRKGLLRHPIVFNLLPEKFIISDIIAIYEQVFNRKIDVRNFRKKLLSSELLIPLGEIQKNKLYNGRPSQLYSLNKIDKKLQAQIHFELSIFLTRILNHV